MRWLLFVILVYVALLLQTTFGNLLMVRSEWPGPIMPDLLAAVAVFFALSLRQSADVVIACWALGLGLDLTTTGAMAGAADGQFFLPPLGPMAIAYTLAGLTVFKLREAFFRERVFSQMILVAFFVVAAHGLYVLIISLVGSRHGQWDYFGQRLVQALLTALYSAALAPLVHSLLRRSEKMLIAPVGGRNSGRER